MNEQNETKATEFSLTPILNPETKEYSLKHFEEMKEKCRVFIEENTIETINTDDDLKTLKTCRANIRKKKDQIKSARLALTKIFSFQFKELESMLDDADTKLKQLKDSKAVQNQKTDATDNDLKEIVLVIKYRDVNVIDSLKKMAVESGCEITEIKEKK